MAATEGTRVRIALRNGVDLPDWTAVQSPAAQNALDAIFSVFDMATLWQGCTEDEDRTRAAVLRLYGELGRAPKIKELAAATGWETGDLRLLLDRLEQRDMLLLDADSSEIIGAYPFTERQTGHRVIFNGHALNAMCAVDALGVGAMFGQDAILASSCRACGAPIRIATRDKGASLERAVPAEAMVWVGIQYEGRAASSLCRVIAFFCSPCHFQAWRNDRSEMRGVRLSVAEALEVAIAIFRPLLAAPQGCADEHDARESSDT